MKTARRIPLLKKILVQFGIEEERGHDTKNKGTGTP